MVGLGDANRVVVVDKDRREECVRLLIGRIVARDILCVMCGFLIEGIYV